MDNYINIIIPIMTLIIGSILTYLLNIKSHKSQYKYSYKAERYSELLVNLQSFMQNSTDLEKRQQFYEDYYRCWLYASENVIKSISVFLFELSHNIKDVNENGKGIELLQNIVVEMRKDTNNNSKIDKRIFQFYHNVNDLVGDSHET